VKRRDTYNISKRSTQFTKTKHNDIVTRPYLTPTTISAIADKPRDACVSVMRFLYTKAASLCYP